MHFSFAVKPIGDAMHGRTAKHAEQHACNKAHPKATMVALSSTKSLTAHVEPDERQGKPSRRAAGQA